MSDLDADISLLRFQGSEMQLSLIGDGSSTIEGENLFSYTS